MYTLDLPRSQSLLTKYALASVREYSDKTYIEKTESGARYKGKVGSEKIVQLFGDSAAFDYSPYENKMDLVFVDGSHARSYTINDTEAALRMIKSHGVIIWHDYASVWPDVTAVIDEYAAKRGRLTEMKRIEGTTLVVCVTK